MPDDPASPSIKPSPIALAALYLAFAAITARAASYPSDPGRRPWFVGLHVAFLLLYTALFWRPGLPAGALHTYFGIQSATVVALLWLNPGHDSVVSLFVLLTYQAALVFRGCARRAWIGAGVALVGLSLMAVFGPVRGLALGLITMAVAAVFPAYAIANHEAETTRAQSQALLAELEATNARLKDYAAEAEELAAVDERNRLARELHDSVSQTMFGVLLAARSTQMLMDREPERVRPELARLQELTQNALAQMRGLIEELRPKS